MQDTTPQAAIWEHQYCVERREPRTQCLIDEAISLLNSLRDHCIQRGVRPILLLHDILLKDIQSRKLPLVFVTHGLGSFVLKHVRIPRHRVYS